MKIVLVIVMLGVLGILALGSYLSFAMPSVSPVEEFQVDLTPERVERGAYLANHVLVCMDCHSSRDITKFSMPLIEGTLGKGGDRFDQSMGFPGTIVAKNISPKNLKNWTDAEIYRAIVCGVDKEGEPIFPLMPYQAYGQLDREDVLDVIAYLRSLPEIDSENITHEIDFPFSLILRSIPQDPKPQKKPDKSDTLGYGRYLVTVAACYDCHTPFESGTYDNTKAYAGGREFPMPSGIVRSSNLTAHPESGIGAWTKQMFIERFKFYSRERNYVAETVKIGEMNTVMPWTMYAEMSVDDLSAIYSYLQSLAPIDQKVMKFTEIAK